MLPREEDMLPPDLLKPEEVRFRTIEVGRGTIQDVLEDNVVAASSVTYDMTFYNRSGFLEELNVYPGMEVKEGDILARLDTGSLEIDIRRQLIEVSRREMALEEVIRFGGSRFARRNAEFDLELAELTLQQMEDEFQKSSITAPIDGEVVFISDYKIGEFVPGRSIVMTIADPSYIHFEYTGSHIPRIKYGMEAEIIIGSQRIPAIVSMTPANAPLEEMQRYRNTIIFSVKNQDDLPDTVRRGSRHQFSIFIEEKLDTIIIPAGAMSTFMGQHYVQVLEDGMRTERDLDIGITTSTHVEVLGGLEEGEILIVGIER